MPYYFYIKIISPSKFSTRLGFDFEKYKYQDFKIQNINLVHE
jgi:hypothetical protein